MDRNTAETITVSILIIMIGLLLISMVLTPRNFSLSDSMRQANCQAMIKQTGSAPVECFR